MAVPQERGARPLLLFWHRGGRANGERTELEGELGLVELGAGFSPVARAQLEIAIARPVSQDAEEVAQVRFGIEAVQLRGEKMWPAAWALIVSAAEEPGFRPRITPARREAGAPLAHRVVGDPQTP